MMIVTINQKKCKACGICEDVCPRHIPKITQNGDRKITLISSQRVELCMACGHCVALCPNRAIEVDGLSYDDYAPIEDSAIEYEQLIYLLRKRRSIRRYKDKPVPRELINRMVEAARCAPTGTSSPSTGVTIIDDAQMLSAFSELVYVLYEKLEKGLRNPIARQFIKRSAGAKRVRTLDDFVMPGMHWYIQWYREGKSNEILRDCPALILFHSPINEPVAAENCLIAAFHALLAAEVIGLGTCFNDIIPPTCNRSSEIRKLLALPESREVYASLTLGFPKYKYKRIPPKNLAEIRYLNL
jgi:nitroreductase/NAD-dependent dihydropyrimidine dehydrogenase PreA subunit